MSRKITDEDDVDSFVPDFRNNRSPIEPRKEDRHPEHYQSRSILGDTAKYEKFENDEIQKNQQALLSGAGGQVSVQVNKSSSRSNQRSSRSRGTHRGGTSRTNMGGNNTKSEEALKRKTAIEHPTSDPEKGPSPQWHD